MSDPLIRNNPVPRNNQEAVRDTGKNVLIAGNAQQLPPPTDFVVANQRYSSGLEDLDDLDIADLFNPPSSAEAGEEARRDSTIRNYPEGTQRSRNLEYWDDGFASFKQTSTDTSGLFPIQTVRLENQSERLISMDPPAQHLQNNQQNFQFQYQLLSGDFIHNQPLYSPATETAHYIEDLTLGSVPENNYVPFDRRGESFVSRKRYFQPGKCPERQKYHQDMRSIQNPSEELCQVSPLLSSSSVQSFSSTSYDSPKFYDNNQQEYQEPGSSQVSDLNSTPVWENHAGSHSNQLLPVHAQEYSYPCVESISEVSEGPARKMAVPRRNTAEKEGRQLANSTSDPMRPNEPRVWNNNEDHTGVSRVKIGSKSDDSHCLDHPIDTEGLLPVGDFLPENDGFQILPDKAPQSNNEPEKPTRNRKSNVQSQKSEEELERGRKSSKTYLDKNKSEKEELPKYIVRMAEELQKLENDNEETENRVQEHPNFNRDIFDRLNDDKTKALKDVCEKWKPENKHMNAVLARFEKYKRASNSSAVFNPEQFGKFLKTSLLDAKAKCDPKQLSTNPGTNGSQKNRRKCLLTRLELELAFSCLSFQIEKNKKVGEELEKMRKELYPEGTEQSPNADPPMKMRKYP